MPQNPRAHGCHKPPIPQARGHTARADVPASCRTPPFRAERLFFRRHPPLSRGDTPQEYGHGRKEHVLSAPSPRTKESRSGSTAPAKPAVPAGYGYKRRRDLRLYRFRRNHCFRNQAEKAYSRRARRHGAAQSGRGPAAPAERLFFRRHSPLSCGDTLQECRAAGVPATP